MMDYRNSYEIIFGSSAELVSLVNTKLDKGYVLVGGVVSLGGVLCQAVARPGRRSPVCPPQKPVSEPPTITACARGVIAKKVAGLIGQFYLQKNQNDYEKAEAEITDLRISKVEVAGKTVTITAARIGKLIGKRGTNVDALGKFLGMEVKMIEDDLYNHLIPVPEMTDREKADEEAMLEFYQNEFEDGIGPDS